MRILFVIFCFVSFLYSDNFKVAYTDAKNDYIKFDIKYINHISKLSDTKFEYLKFYSDDEMIKYINNNKVDVIINLPSYVKNENFIQYIPLGFVGNVNIDKTNIHLQDMLKKYSQTFAYTTEYKKLYEELISNNNSAIYDEDIKLYIGLSILFVILLIVFAFEKFFAQTILLSKKYLENKIKTTTTNLDIEKQKLKKIEDAFNMAQSIAHIGTFDWDIRNDIMWWSDEMYHLYGYNKCSYSPTINSFYEHMLQDDISFVSKKIQQSLLGIENFKIQYKVQNVQQETVYILAQAHIIRDENNKAIRMIGTNQDITSQIDLEDKLQEINKYLQNQVDNQVKKRVKSEVRYQMLFETMTNAIFVIENDVFVDCNALAVQLFEFDKKEDIIGLNQFDLSPQYQADGELTIIKKEKIKKGLCENKKIEFDWLYLTKNKNELYFRVQLFVTKIDSKDVVYAICKDITKEKQLEKKQAKQENLLIQQSKMATMGEMIAMIAHQWRQPLSAILALTQSIEFKAKMNVLDNDFLEQQLNQTKDIIMHMSKTIDDFRNFFKPKAQKEEIMLKDIVQKSIEFAEVSLKQNNIKIENNIKSDKKFFIYKSEMMQVLLNLLANAKDALIEQNIENGLIKIDLEEYNDYSILSIKDNAGGIPQEIIDKIFDPYFSTKSHNGTGLGLYMSKVIIEDHLRGKLYVENAKDGAEFKIWLNNI